MHDAAQVEKVAVNARHVGCEFLVAVHGEPLLQRQLEPALAQIAAGTFHGMVPCSLHSPSSILDLIQAAQIQGLLTAPNGLNKRCSMRLLLTSRGR